MLADAFLRAENLDELAELVGYDAPSHAQMPAERERLVLQRDEDLAQAGVDAVAQREVDDPVGTAEIDGGLGTLARQRVEPLPCAPGQHHDEDVVEHRTSLPPQDHSRRGAVSADQTERKTIHLVHSAPAFGDPLDWLEFERWVAGIRGNARGQGHAHILQAGHARHKAVMISPATGATGSPRRVLTATRPSPIIGRILSDARTSTALGVRCCTIGGHRAGPRRAETGLDEPNRPSRAAAPKPRRLSRLPTPRRAAIACPPTLASPGATTSSKRSRARSCPSSSPSTRRRSESARCCCT